MREHPRDREHVREHVRDAAREARIQARLEAREIVRTREARDAARARRSETSALLARPSEEVELPRGGRGPWRTRDVIRGALAALAVFAGAALLYQAHTLVFVAFLGVLFGLAVATGADYLQRLRIPRGAGAPLIVLVALGLLIGFGAWTGPTVASQYNELRQRLPLAAAKLDRWIGQQDGIIGSVFSSRNETTAAADSAKVATSLQQQADTTGILDRQIPDSLKNLQNIKNSLSRVLAGSSRYVFPVISSTVSIVSMLILVLFIAIYIGIDPDLYRRGMLSLVPSAARPRWDRVLSETATALRKWLTTQLIAMLVIGSVTTIALLLIGVKAALPLGILAGLLEFVPTIGPILSSVPAIAMAFVDSPEKALVVALAYIGIQFLENHLLIPLLMKEGVDIPPVVTVLTQAVMVLAFGFMGLFIAVPLVVLITVMVKLLYVESIGGPHRRSDDW